MRSGVNGKIQKCLEIPQGYTIKNGTTVLKNDFIPSRKNGMNKLMDIGVIRYKVQSVHGRHFIETNFIL